MTTSSQTFMIPAGDCELEVKLWRSTEDLGGEPTSVALLCHPHPLYGGTMEDGVLTVAREAFLARGLSVIGFNLPGVGQSTGQSRGDLSEWTYLASICQFISKQHWILSWAAGYSYGGALLTCARGALPAESKVLLIAPAMGLIQEAPDVIESAPSVVGAVVGANDPFSNPDEIRALFPEMEIKILEGVDHFFSGGSERLADAIAELIDGT